MFTVYCLLPTAYYLLLTVYCLLSTVYCPLPAAYCLLPTAYCLLLTAYCLLRTAYCVLRTAYCVLRTRRYFLCVPLRLSFAHEKAGKDSCYVLLTPDSSNVIAMYCLLPTPQGFPQGFPRVCLPFSFVRTES